MFERYIGIDYSGAGAPRMGNSGIALAENDANNRIHIINNTNPHHRLPNKTRLSSHTLQRWSREDIYLYLRNEFISSNKRMIVGIDHGFSYPTSLLQHYKDWDGFLRWFKRTWKTTRYSVDECKNGLKYSNSTEKRLVEKEFTANAKSVVDLERHEGRQGTVSYSSHAGIVWISRLRRLQQLKLINVHFWPFDGLEAKGNAHVLFEAYPSIYKRRVPVHASMNEHEQDAFAIASWLRDRDQDNTLLHYLKLQTLNSSEIKKAQVEGWILGCL